MDTEVAMNILIHNWFFGAGWIGEVGQLPSKFVCLFLNYFIQHTIQWHTSQDGFYVLLKYKYLHH